MLQYNVYANAGQMHTLSEQENLAMQPEVRCDYRTWFAAGCSLIGDPMSMLHGVMKKAFSGFALDTMVLAGPNEQQELK